MRSSAVGVVVAALLWAVIIAPVQAAPATSGSPSPSHSWLSDSGGVNRGGAAGLSKVVAAVTRIEVRQAEGGRRLAVLSNGERDRLKALVAGGGLDDNLAVAPPPWPVVIVFRTRAHGSFVATLVDQARLRINAADPLSARGVAPVAGRIPIVSELALDDRDLWLWRLLERHLGPTAVKEYRVAQPPASLRVPPQPP